LERDATLAAPPGFGGECGSTNLTRCLTTTRIPFPVALLEGSGYSATHDERAGETYFLDFHEIEKELQMRVGRLSQNHVHQESPDYDKQSDRHRDGRVRYVIHGSTPAPVSPVPIKGT
jgi:hypothetical protein